MPITYASGSGSAGPPRLSTPEWWFEKVVKENVEDFENNPVSIRRAFNAVVTTYHFPERIWHYHEQRGSLDKLGCGSLLATEYQKFRECLEKREDLRLLGDVVNPTKHHVRNRTSKEDPFKYAVATDMARSENGELRIYDAQGKCYGRTLDLLNTTIQYWERWLAKHPS